MASTEQPIAYQEVKCNCISAKAKEIILEALAHRMNETSTEKRDIEKMIREGNLKDVPEAMAQNFIQHYTDRIGHYNALITMFRDIPICSIE